MTSRPHLTDFKKERKSGFTLVELLIVIIIIAALAALVFPMVGMVREKAQRTKCANNLRQWSVAFYSYAADHNQLVRYRDWGDIGLDAKFYNSYFGDGIMTYPESRKAGPIQGYMRKCPSQPWDGIGNPPTGYLVVRPNELNASGAYSKNTLDTDGDPLQKEDSYVVSKMARPAQYLMMMDSVSESRPYNKSDLITLVKPLCANTDKSKIRHGGGVNALFGDGHVEYLLWTDIDPNSANNSAKVTNWFNLD